MLGMKYINCNSWQEHLMACKVTHILQKRPILFLGGPSLEVILLQSEMYGNITFDTVIDK